MLQDTFKVESKGSRYEEVLPKFIVPMLRFMLTEIGNLEGILLNPIATEVEKHAVKNCYQGQCK